jgi:hypothetical protein
MMTTLVTHPDHAPTLPEAAGKLANWGFLAHADLPDQPGPAWLLVALRDVPTFRHFDPELIELWVHREAVGQRLVVTRETRVPIERDFSWGTVRIVDRLGVSNEYVTFGGHVSADEIGDATVCVLSSPAPLLRRGGHSQPADVASFDLSAFFARLMIAVDYTPGFEAAFGEASALGRYAAFVGDFVTRYSASAILQGGQPDAYRVLRAEQTRLRAREPEAWAEGERLRRMAALR